MKRLALVGFPDGLARQDIAPTLFVCKPMLSILRLLDVN
jgi:hypothetical protein